MNKENRIIELEKKIKHIKDEPIKGWIGIGKLTKYAKIKKIEIKIESLKKRK